MIGNYITSNLYNEVFSESSEPSTVKIAQLFSKHFIPDLSLFVSFISFFIKARDTFAIPQSSVHHLVYDFPMFFCFHKCLNNFYSSKNLPTNKFFH